MGSLNQARAIAPFLTALTPPPQSFDKVAFAMCSCSQCGTDIGMGTSGVSDCRDHTPKERYTGPTAEFETDTGTLVLRYDYQPEERATRNEPGCDEDVEITGVMVGEVDILEFCSDEAMDKFKDAVWESIREAREQDQQDRAEARYLDRMEMSL